MTRSPQEIYSEREIGEGTVEVFPLISDFRFAAYSKHATRVYMEVFRYIYIYTYSLTGTCTAPPPT